MAKLLDFPKPQGQFLASINLWREPDGSILATLSAMDSSVIERMDGGPHEKMQRLALWVNMGAESLAEQADALKE